MTSSSSFFFPRQQGTKNSQLSKSRPPGSLACPLSLARVFFPLFCLSTKRETSIKVRAQTKFRRVNIKRELFSQKSFLLSSHLFRNSKIIVIYSPEQSLPRVTTSFSVAFSKITNNYLLQEKNKTKKQNSVAATSTLTRIFKRPSNVQTGRKIFWASWTLTEVKTQT